MINYIMYNKDTGKIKSLGSAQTRNLINVRANCEFMETIKISDTERKYVDLSEATPKIKNRPTLDWSDEFNVNTTESIILSDVPANTAVYLDDTLIATVDDGTLELEIPLSGEYKLKLVPPFPYYEKIISVEVI